MHSRHSLLMLVVEFCNILLWIFKDVSISTEFRWKWDMVDIRQCDSTDSFLLWNLRCPWRLRSLDYLEA